MSTARRGPSRPLERPARRRSRAGLASARRRFCEEPRVLLRILVDDKAGIATMRLFGRLDADGVAELQKSCDASTGTIELDLSQLRSIDDVGAAYLGGLVDAGVKVVQVNPYVAALLRLGGSVDRRQGRRGGTK